MELLLTERIRNKNQIQIDDWDNPAFGHHHKLRSVNYMSIITQLERHVGKTETTIKGVVNSVATYEVIDDFLIIRTSTHDTIHLTQEIGQKLVDIINSELL